MCDIQIAQGNVCPKCESMNNKVTDTRSWYGDLKRRRKCMDCDYRWATYEITDDEYNKLISLIDIISKIKEVNN